MNKKEIEMMKERYEFAKENYLEEVPEYVEALRMSVEALEKQIPKKPVFAGGRYNCQCGWDICRDKQPYCMMCGNAIDWEV